MVDNCCSFRLNSTHNSYVITIKALTNENPEKLEITLIHKFPIEDITFFLQKSKADLAKENIFFSQFNSINEIFEYLIKIIKSENIKIIKSVKPEITNYFIYFFDQEKKLDFQISIPKIQKVNNEMLFALQEKIKSQGKEIKQLQKQINRISKINIQSEKNDNDNNNNEMNRLIEKSKKQEEEIKDLKERIEKLSGFNQSIVINNKNPNNNLNNMPGGNNGINNINPMNNLNNMLGECKGSENEIHQSGLQDVNERNILKENNNNISFDKIPTNFANEKIVSKENEECENFTAFTNKNNGSIIVWTIKGKGILNLFDFKKDRTKDYQAHDFNIDCIQYFHDHNELIDYIISLSKLDEETLKIWQFDDENELKLTKIFKKQFFQKEVELFCIFNYNYYDDSNSYLFIYGKQLLNKKNKNNNPSKNKEIICYKLDKNLNDVIWERNEDGIIKYKRINNFYKINNLDTYYDYNKNKDLFLINCNENNTEVISKLFDYYRGSIFRYKDWNHYQNAFIKEVDFILKLFQISINGLAIWDIEKKEEEAAIYFDNFCPFDLISWNDNYLLASGVKEIIILEITGKQIEKKFSKEKAEGYSKIRKIITPQSFEIVVAIDNHKVKYWSFN